MLNVLERADIYLCYHELGGVLLNLKKESDIYQRQIQNSVKFMRDVVTKIIDQNVEA